MKNRLYLTILTFYILTGLSLAACSAATPSPAQQPTPLELEPSPTIEPTNSPIPSQPSATALPPTEAESTLPAASVTLEFPLEYPQPGTVVLDMVATACREKWVNGSHELPCPGDREDLSEGYVEPASKAVIEGEIHVEAPLLIGLPGSGGEHGLGLFGTYPQVKIEPGDTFHAVLACQEGTTCDVEFALEYYDEQGKYHPEMGWSWQHRYGGGAVPVQVDLSPLAGQTVQLTLVVRDQGTPEDDWVVWIYPYVARAALE